MLQNYDNLIETISRLSGKAIEEINRLVEAKRAKLSGLVSKEGAAQIIAVELGINFDKEKVKINELMPGIKKVNVIGKIIKLFPIREYKKEKREGKVVNFILADETANIRTVLWDVNHISLVEKGDIKEGDVVEITNGSLRNTELHLTGFSDIKKSNQKLEEVRSDRIYAEKKISEFVIGGNFSNRGIIVQIFEPRGFEVCPECGKKVINTMEGIKCEKHGLVVPNKRHLLSLVIDDGTENIRGVLFSEAIEKLGLKTEDLELNKFLEKRQGLLGKELVFSGQARQNQMFNNMEFFVSDVSDVSVDSLIESLEKS